MTKPTLFLVAMACATLCSPKPADADPRRFAVFVGSNIGDRHEDILHHAEDDAIRVAQTLRTLGDFPADQVLVLNGVTATELRESILRLNMRIHEQPDAVLVLFYSGHADAESLHLAGTHLALTELKALPRASRSWAAGGATKGLAKRPWLIFPFLEHVMIVVGNNRLL